VIGRFLRYIYETLDSVKPLYPEDEGTNPEDYVSVDVAKQFI
jgi:hypothetical protein